MASLFAYLDPGTGSIIIQIAAAAVLSCGVMFRQYLISPFAALLGRKKKEESKPY